MEDKLKSSVGWIERERAKNIYAIRKKISSNVCMRSSIRYLGNLLDTGYVKYYQWEFCSNILSKRLEAHSKLYIWYTSVGQTDFNLKLRFLPTFATTEARRRRRTFESDLDVDKSQFWSQSYKKLSSLKRLIVSNSLTLRILLFTS